MRGDSSSFPDLRRVLDEDGSLGEIALRPAEILQTTIEDPSLYYYKFILEDTQIMQTYSRLPKYMCYTLNWRGNADMVSFHEFPPLFEDQTKARSSRRNQGLLPELGPLLQKSRKRTATMTTPPVVILPVTPRTPTPFHVPSGVCRPSNGIFFASFSTRQQQASRRHCGIGRTLLNAPKLRLASFLVRFQVQLQTLCLTKQPHGLPCQLWSLQVLQHRSQGHLKMLLRISRIPVSNQAPHRSHRIKPPHHLNSRKLCGAVVVLVQTVPIV
ncbi:hypothetical protein HPB47_014401 [Ixodes persulcatus]|uniref:Uncharacterized protein n=1 Tax=Ixodes persulcatus TaxID=34615 RepID=A0AC60R232_IXOPE|nr:hypothetical protein HPB47_014401 [Ixodes persulcatus]